MHVVNLNALSSSDSEHEPNNSQGSDTSSQSTDSTDTDDSEISDQDRWLSRPCSTLHDQIYGSAASEPHRLTATGEKSSDQEVDPREMVKAEPVHVPIRCLTYDIISIPSAGTQKCDLCRPGRQYSSFKRGDFTHAAFCCGRGFTSLSHHEKPESGAYCAHCHAARVAGACTREPVLTSFCLIGGTIIRYTRRMFAGWKTRLIHPRQML